MIRPIPHFAQMAPYAVAAINAPRGKTPISLSQNESLRAPSPAALEAAAKAVGDVALYPESDWKQLREALAQTHALDPGNVVCGAGSLDLIACLMRVYAGPGRAVLAPANAYPFFRTAAQMANARFDAADELDYTVSVSALLSSVQPDTAVVCVANPGNPTGTRIGISELRRLRSALPEDVLLVVDEAYGEFADHMAENAFEMVESGNTVVLRTFSKAYGLAGLRVGWGAFPRSIAANLLKALNPSNVSRPALAAALAALQDQAYMRETCVITAELRAEAIKRLRQDGFLPIPSLTNFVLIDFQSRSAAESADAFLRNQGIILRPQGGAGLPHCLRMTIAPPGAMAAALDALGQWRQEFQL